MADGGGFRTTRFNNPNSTNLKNNWTDFNARNNALQTREPRRSGSMSKMSDSNSKFGGKSDVYRHQLDRSRGDGGRNHFQSGQVNINEGYNNRNVNFTCDVSQSFNAQMNSSYQNSNSTTNLTSHGQDISQGPNQVVPNFSSFFQMSPTQNVPPFVGMMPPGPGIPMQPNCFSDVPHSYAQNHMFSDSRQFRDTGIPFPPPMYDTQGNICIPPPPTPMLPPTLPQNNQASYGSHPGLMPIQGGMALPPIEVQEVKEQDIVSKSDDQEWVNKFVKERGHTDKDVEKKPKIKVGETRQILQKWLRLLDDLTLQRDKLMGLIKCSESEWQREIQKFKILKEKLNNTQRKFSTEVDIDSLSAELQRKKRKRKWQSKRRQDLAKEKSDSEKKKFEMHLTIDNWRENETAKIQAKHKAASMKQEAGGLLGEIRRKQSDSSKSLNLLQALMKLRNFRKQEAELKGVYPKPVAEQNKHFHEKILFLEKIMKKHQELYESEEKTLVVMLAEEEEEKEREKREKNQRKQLAQAASSDSNDPMRDFYRYYTQAENGLGSLVHIRHGWDMYIVPDSIPGASYIPQGSISAVEPSSAKWASMAEDKG